MRMPTSNVADISRAWARQLEERQGGGGGGEAMMKDTTYLLFSSGYETYETRPRSAGLD